MGSTQLTPTQMMKILDAFGVEYSDFRGNLRMACPIHQSDNPDSCTVYLDTGTWKCWTNSCQEEVMDDFKPRGAGFTGLVRGLIELETNEFVGYRTAFERIAAILDEEIKGRRKDSYNAGFETFSMEPTANEVVCSKEYVRRSLQIPSPYFLKRMFSPEVLEHFSVGECRNEEKEMYGRAVAPVFSSSGEDVIGAVGRSLYRECSYCSLYHPGSNCEGRRWPKWKNSMGFRADCYLYNWWSREAVKKQKKIVLVEGQGDVWRLWEAGFHAFGLFSSSLAKGQLALLESLFLDDVVIATDNDEAGREAAQKIQNQLLGKFHTQIFHPKKKDWGEMTPEEVREWLTRKR